MNEFAWASSRKCYWLVVFVKRIQFPSCCKTDPLYSGWLCPVIRLSSVVCSHTETGSDISGCHACCYFRPNFWSVRLLVVLIDVLPPCDSFDMKTAPYHSTKSHLNCRCSLWHWTVLSMKCDYHWRHPSLMSDCPDALKNAREPVFAWVKSTFPLLELKSSQRQLPHGLLQYLNQLSSS